MEDIERLIRLEARCDNTDAQIAALTTSLTASLAMNATVGEVRGSMAAHIDECKQARQEDLIDRKDFRREVVSEFSDIRKQRADAQQEVRRLLFGILTTLLIAMGSMTWYFMTHIH